MFPRRPSPHLASVGYSLVFHSVLLGAVWLVNFRWMTSDSTRVGTGQIEILKISRPIPKGPFPRISRIGKKNTQLGKSDNQNSPGTASASHSPGQGTSGPDPSQSFLNEIREKIQSELEYPLSVRNRGIEGQVKVKIVIDTNGSLISSQIAQSSGHPELDRLAIEATLHAAPFSVDDHSVGRLSLSLPIRFRLN